jgi:hypothetical protein
MNHESAAAYKAFYRINHIFSGKQSFEQNIAHAAARSARTITATLQQNSEWPVLGALRSYAPFY